ncbi:hypothetical protein POKO110462_08725 [Pontibacter korlensis]|uniref:STAS domain-containing protein n=1 Tax=Pontibacter korlensis TaxID=400092 RepID=A0A0E3UVJ6_9BACT|nr:hypothetical protein [Pontibacter korlensis]AKD02587.1 hypothetical protein PKOR_04925 [Pontibacter korlensis]
MQAFLYVDLTSDTSFQQPVVEEVHKSLPSVSVLDIDARSDKLLQHYALRLLREAARAVVCIKAEEHTQDLGSLMPLLEELFQEGKQRLVLLQGQHPRLQRIFSARSHVAFKVVTEEEVVQEVKRYCGELS